jgi:hypothetical protein
MFHIAQTSPILLETLGTPYSSPVAVDVARSVAARVLVSFALIAVGVSIGATFA